MGLLEDMEVTICGIQFDHTFVVVDFKQETNYEVIVRRPFMHQLLVVHDWGYNHLYLHHGGNIIRVNLDYHSYRDVTKTLVEDFESSSYNQTQRQFGNASLDEGA